MYIMILPWNIVYSWIGRPIWADNQFANEPEGLRQFQDRRWKALGEENPDLSGLFFVKFIFDLFFSK